MCSRERERDSTQCRQHLADLLDQIEGRTSAVSRCELELQCQQQEIRAFQRLQGPPPKGVSLKDYSVAVAECSKQWPDDFRLRARCMDQQIAEKRKYQERD